MKQSYKLAAIFCLVLPATVPAANFFVDCNGTNPVAPYADWPTAATNIQDAVDAANAGDQIFVADGIYQTGGRPVNGYTITNRVVLNKAVTLQSVNGPEVTMIVGYQMPGAIIGNNAVRCVYMTNGATLIGFTVTNGATETNGFDYDYHESDGGGIWGESTNASIANCLIIDNASEWDGGGAMWGCFTNCTFEFNAAGTYGYGGGAYGALLNNCVLIGNSAHYGGGANSGRLNNCILTNNSAWGGGGGIGGVGNAATANNCFLAGNFGGSAGGASMESTLNNCVLVGNSVGINAWGGGDYEGTLSNCLLASNSAPGVYGYGGGAYQSTLNNCRLLNNWAGQYGGGSYYGTLNSCLVTSNWVASGFGGGVYYGTLNNCTITANAANAGGGTYFSTLNNCIVYFNNAPQFPNYYRSNLVSFCCTTPYAGNAGNLTNDPGFVNFAACDLHLNSNSPCINSGNNGYAATANDLDGNPRIVGRGVDIGAYEYQTPGFTLPFLWAQQYGISTDGSIDTDGDGMNNWQEWATGTNPTNPASLLKILSVSNSATGPTVRWQSVNGLYYILQSSTNLFTQPAFTTVGIYILGRSNTTSVKLYGTNTPSVNFYRVSVQ
jgi:hypothetical protein